MLETQSQNLQVAQDSIGSDTRDVAEIEPEPIAGFYERAEDVAVRSYTDQYSFHRFVDAVLDRVGIGHTHEDAKLVDELVAPEDVHFGILLAYPDESLMFVGSDPTAKDSIPWFAFTIDRHEPVPAPETAQDALDMLKPPDVQDVEHTENWLPDRHGEWWLVPSEVVPVSTPFKPGVSSRPFGPSPLGNHVPREYAFTRSDDAFMQAFRTNTNAPSTIATVPEALEWTFRQVRKKNPPDHAPDWSDIRTWAGNVLVRGTIRHRDDDHYVENVGEVWHKAVTHNVEVYTGDGIATDIHLDYHG